MNERLWRYDGRRAVVTGCASGIGAHLATQLADLGAHVTGLDLRRPERSPAEFVEVDFADPASIDRAVGAIEGPVDALFNVAGVSSGIGNPLLVVTINFLGMRHFTEALLDRMKPGSAIANVSSLAASNYLANAAVTAGLLATGSMAEGISWCEDNPAALADGGYRLSKEAVILYGMTRALDLGERGIRINCTGPGVTETPILDQLKSAYGQDYLEAFPTLLGHVCGPDEQASVLAFLNSPAASYISGQVIWVDGGSVANKIAEGLEVPR
ncbi:coniferyl-alcohol dehydrogenase [Mycolicibacterium diernhoferi]|uniref:3-alpha-hydroxysteroid dehydrogenase n=1 Tax=Mycolicibacterium diernhoferi TaxID=1801 RepID=A0A1Q4HKM2_9MYCO|nr:coniferyl-alcohol dehydrogenase [Mycolicibacterium diernhoferi]OJZ68088.1 3-alpha-hydroxysteroid dehydrogenase [Mycolicibacterium diernhoferi]OPE55120.1 3-alpha-hydroxysteroid dehydrogenase [Mycolicibacterium diernhoferi]PEG53580.1 3-alpha-hydroxysteroid dehydrogenase [Mycolicibacterium diernhoferi]QYL21425.1 coniferyl-alcohol dehydrogenase [Mycolicibacterium diernhoferi]